MQITYFYRADVGGVSIERLFADVRGAMAPEVEQRVWRARFGGTNPWKMLRNCLSARRAQGQINHITGDIHYLSIFLSPGRTVLTIHDCAGFERLHGWRRKLFSWLWYQWPVHRAAVVTVISESARRELLRHVACDPAKIRVVENCISPTFHHVPKTFNADKPVILQVGVGWNKNLPRVVEALRGISCHLRVIGPVSDAVRQVLETSGLEYSLAGRVSDEQLVREYEACDMLVFASLYEGFGLPIAEAQTVGRPVVTSDRLSMPEVAGPNGACLVDPYEVEAIRRGVLQVIQDHEYRAGLVEAGLQNARRFDANRTASEYLRIYHEILERGEVR